MDNRISITINGRPLRVGKDITILEAARKVNIKIPTLCHYLNESTGVEHTPGACRVCVVEIEGMERLMPACATRVWEGMRVRTSSIRAINARRTIVELLLSDHPKDCLTCPKNGICELQSLAAELDIREIHYEGEMSEFNMDKSSYSIYRDLSKCILCRRCIEVCSEVQTVNVLSAVNRGFNTVIAPAFELPMIETACTFCGQCLAACPTGALTEISNIRKVWKLLNDPDKFVIVQTAPAIRAALGEEFGEPPGTNVTGRMVTALRRLGFKRVFDTNFAADITVMEEAHEFVDRLKNNGRLPILTSCCPGWVKFIEHQFSDLLDIPSTCKSPHEMFGSIAKSYYAEKMEIPREKMAVVSVMPCVAKKYEAARPELERHGEPDVDVVITTRELAGMIKEAGIDFCTLPGETFDNPLGESSGAGTIFGASGGVAEAALRTAADILIHEDLHEVEYRSLRGLEGIKEATYRIGDMEINVAAANGLGNARKLFEEVQNGTSKYHIIEVMACPGGCIGGGGQPYSGGSAEILEKRIQALYHEDRGKITRKAHKNPSVLKIYKDYLGQPYYGKKAHELLHTHYVKRQKM